MSIADALRAEQTERLKRLSVEQRVQLAFELGRRDVALYAARCQLSSREAKRRLVAQRKTGRRHSASAGG